MVALDAFLIPPALCAVSRDAGSNAGGTIPNFMGRTYGQDARLLRADGWWKWVRNQFRCAALGFGAQPADETVIVKRREGASVR